MAKYIGLLIVFSVFLIFVASKPAKRKHRNSDLVDFEEKIEEEIEETIKEEHNESLIAVLTKFNDFYTDILPELKLTLNTDCEEDKQNATGRRYELAPASSLDCLTLDAISCAMSLKKQFNKKVKEKYIADMKTFITKVSEIYTAIKDELPDHDPHEKELVKFLDLISTDLPKLKPTIDLDALDKMFNAMHDDLKPKFANAKIDDESKQLYESLVVKHRSDLPSKEDLNEGKNSYINQIWNELVDDLQAVELLKRL